MKKLRLGVLFSGGKDSVLAMHRVAEKEDVVCLITIVSENKESYMFHTPNIDLVDYQAIALDLPLIKVKTKGEKEKELLDLKRAIKKAKRDFELDGIVSGAVMSTYQKNRIQKICADVGLICFNPLWQMNQIDLLRELIKRKFDVRIVGVFAYPFSEKWLGKKIDESVVLDLIDLQNKYEINPAGEGGEIETFVLDAPLFKKKIKIEKSLLNYSNNAGVLNIKKISLLQK